MVPSAAESVRFGDDATGGTGGVITARSRGRDGDDLLVDISIGGAGGAEYAHITGLRYTP
ncbi:hypothetical protein H7I42_14800, partial [Mycolicibacterium vanbaalenii PYR-1]|nr:hypothetical protein [Mycolicibacterium vanbaalenii PYR-1]